MLAVENLHVDISRHHIVLVDKVLDVDQKGRNVVTVLFEKLKEVIDVVHLVDLIVTLGALGALGPLVLVLVEVDVDVGDEVLKTYF